MSDKKSNNIHAKEQSIGFDSRDLDPVVVEQMRSNEDYETQMIANFNAKVNSIEYHKESTKHSNNVGQEQGGSSGLEPTRYGDWEKKGRCYDF